MATSQAGSPSFSPKIALCLALLGAASMLYYHQGLFIPRARAAQRAEGLGNGYLFGNDFYQVWLTSKQMAQRRDLYSPQTTREIQTGLYGRPLDPGRPGDPIDQRVFPYPAFADLLFWPASKLPFPIARMVFVCTLGALTFVSILLWLRALGWNLDWKWVAVLLLLTLSSYPALEGLFAGQLGLFVAFLLASSIFALRQNRFLLAGVLLAIGTVKPQVIALAILFLLIWSFHDWRTRGRLAIGFFTTLVLLIGTSLAVMPQWVQSWVRTVLAYRHYTPPPLLTQVLTLFVGQDLAGTVTLVLTVASVIIVVALAWQSRSNGIHSFVFWITLSVVLSMTTILILPGLAIYDHLILIPSILLVIRYRNAVREAGRASRILLAIGALVLFWPWIAAFTLACLRPWFGFYSTAILLLPIRNAVSLPFAVLALLVWIWRIRSTKIQAPA